VSSSTRNRNSSEVRPRIVAQRELRAPRAAGIAGLLFAILFGASLILLRPPLSASDLQLLAWYTGAARKTVSLVGLYLIPFAGIAFLWFIGVVNDRIGRREDRFFSTVFLGSGLLFVAMLFAAAASASAIALRADIGLSVASINAGVLQFALALTNAFLYVYAARTAGVFMIVTSTIAWRTRSVPGWVAIVGFVIAVLLLLSLRYFQILIMLFPAWVALLSVFILATPGKVEIDDAFGAPNEGGSSPREG
jgi:MFS family permease